MLDWNILDQLAVAALETGNDELAQVRTLWGRKLTARAVWTDYLLNSPPRRGRSLF